MILDRINRISRHRRVCLRHEQNCKIEEVLYDSVIVGDFFADMLVEGAVMVENKSVQALVAVHEVQLVNYLTATGIEVGLLLNFGSASLEVKRKTRTYRPKSS